MADDNGFDPRSEVLNVLLEKVAADTYPSETMLDLIEQLAQPDEIPAYAAILVDKVRADTYPSISMLKRLVELSG
jgi:hypothetical protein